MQKKRPSLLEPFQTSPSAFEMGPNLQHLESLILTKQRGSPDPPWTVKHQYLGQGFGLLKCWCLKRSNEWGAIQTSSEIIRRAWDIQWLVVTAVALDCRWVKMFKKVIECTSGLLVRGCMGLAALRRESWAHIQTDTMCCFNSLSSIKFQRLRACAHTQYKPLSFRHWLSAVETPFSHT